MISEKDKKIIKHLRHNARMKLTDLSKKIDVPVTTLYSKLKNFEKQLIKKHTCLIDYNQLGYYKNIYLVMKANEKKTELRDFLHQHSCVNSLYRVNYGFDFLVECIFKDEKEVTDFLELLQEDFRPEVQMLNIIEELKKEEFMIHRPDLKKQSTD